MPTNTFANTNWVSMEILRLLLNKLTVAEYFNRSWEKDFRKEFAPGSNITVKFPQRMLAVDGMGYAPQGINRISTTISLDQWIQVPFEWDDYEAAVKLERSEEELREQYWDPAAAAIAQETDSRCAKFAYQNASQVVGVLGTDPTAVSMFHSARQRLQDSACPAGKRAMLLSSSAVAAMGSATAAGSIVTMLQPGDEVSQMFKEGSLGRIASFDVFESNSLYSHTAGHWAGTSSYPKVAGASQSGTSLKLTCNAGDTFKHGDKFNVALVNAVNPMTRRIAGKARLKEFTITQDLTAVGDGTDVLNFLPAIYGPGSQYQNVDALPANAAQLTLWPGTTTPNDKVGTVGLALTRFAFAIVGAKLFVPKSTEQAGQATDPDTGISVRKVIAWDAVRSMQIHRLDSLQGYGNLYQDNGAVAVACA